MPQTQVYHHESSHNIYSNRNRLLQHKAEQRVCKYKTQVPSNERRTHIVTKENINRVVTVSVCSFNIKLYQERDIN